jgi:hypothetical protein
MNVEQTYDGQVTDDVDDSSGNSYDGRDGRKFGGRYRDEVYSKRVPAGKRTYFFDVKSTRSGDDYFVTITESKRIDDTQYEKHKIFLYKEDFGKFVSALHEVVQHIVDERLPEYEFRNLPGLAGDDGSDSSRERD